MWLDIVLTVFIFCLGCMAGIVVLIFPFFTLDDRTWQWLKDSVRPWLWRAGYDYVGMPENKQADFMSVLGSGLPENLSPSEDLLSLSESEESDDESSPAQNAPSIAE